MAVKFICDCGEHFRARDEIAAHPSVCPRCGALVTLPSPALAKVPTDAPQLLGPDAVHLVLPMQSPQKPARRPRWPLETRWNQCLLYPLRAWFLLLYLAGGLAGVTGAAVLTLPDPPAFLGRQQWFVLGFCLLALFVLAYACGFLQCALSSGLAGEAGRVRWPACNLLLVLRSAAVWLLCFLAGPVVLVAGGFFYWL